jgi:hypothetical protein
MGGDFFDAREQFNHPLIIPRRSRRAMDMLSYPQNHHPFLKSLAASIHPFRSRKPRGYLE